MPDETDNKIELSASQTRVWVLIGVVGVLMLLVQGFFTYVITSTGTEVRETNRNLVEVNATIRVQQERLGNLQEKVKNLEDSKEKAATVHQVHDTRLNSIEQRLALHDQWIQAHNHP